MKKKKHQQRFHGRAASAFALAERHWFWAVALFLTVTAPLSASSLSRTPSGIHGYANFYYDYDLGYNHRGFMGSLFRLFYGDPVYEVLKSAIPAWHKAAIFIALAASALLLLIPIARLKIHFFTRWLLLSFAAVLLFAPAWRFSVQVVGSLDLYVFVLALAATFCLVKKHAGLFAIFNIIGYLIHPQMIFYSALFIVIVIHAVLSAPGYHARARQWLTAAFLPLAAAGALYFVNSPEYNIAAVEKYGLFAYYAEHDKIALINDFLNPGTRTREWISGSMSIRSWNYFVVFVFFSIIPFAFLCFMIAVIRRQNPAVLTGEYPFPVPVIGRYKNLLRRADAYLLLAAAFAVSYPVLLVATDFHRFLHLSQWMAPIVFIYLLWNSPAHAKPGGRKEKAGPLTKCATGACFMLAYAFAGAPVVDAMPGGAHRFPCENFCVPLLTDKNPLGDFYSSVMYKAAKSSRLPAEADARAMRRYGIDYLKNIRLEDDALIIPEQHAGLLFQIQLGIEKGEKVEVRLRYSSASPPPLKLLLYNRYEVPAVSISENEAVWHFSPNQKQFFWLFSVYTEGGAALNVEKFRIERI